MVASYVLIKSKSDRIYASLSGMKEVTELHPLYGDYNIIAKIETETTELAGEISDKIKGLEGVLETKRIPGLKNLR